MAGREQGIRVLLVEDDPESGQAMRVMLERRGVETTFVKSGETALAVFSEAAFDIVVADIRMRDMTGVDLLREIKAQNPEFPLILITGYDSIHSAIEAVRLKADDYILKPLDRIEDLLIPMQRAVAHHRTTLKNRAMETEMRESRHKYETILSSMNDLVFVLDADQRFVLQRSDGKTALYTSPDKFLGKPHGEVMPQDVDKLFQEAFGKAKKGEMAEYEYSLTHANGRTEHWLAKVTPIMEDKQFLGVVCVARDITERKEAERRLRNMAAQLCVVEERARRKLAMALHESVLQIVGFSKGVAADIAEESRENEVREHASQVVAWLGDAVSRIRSVTFDLYPPALYASGLRAALEQLAAKMSNEHGIRIEVSGDPVPRGHAEDVKGFVFGATLELLNNVVKHAKASRALVSIQQQDGHLSLEVEDNGSGFVPNAEKGLHFGLAALRERAQNMAGEFKVSSMPGRGTKACLHVPVSVPERPGASHP